MKISEQLPFLSESGVKSLKESIWATIFKQLAGWFSFACSMILVRHTLTVLHGGVLDKSYILSLFTLGLGLMVVEILLTKIQYKVSNIPTYHESERLRMAIAAKLGEVPMSYYNGKDISEITGSLMNDCADVEHLLSGMLPNFYASLVTIPLTFIALAICDWRLALAAFASVPFAFAIQFISMKEQARLTDKQLVVKRKAISRIQEYMDGMQQIRANSQRGEKCKELTLALLELKKASLKMELTSGVFTAGAEVFLQIGIGIVVFAATKYLIKDTVDVFAMILFFSAVLRLYVPIATQITRLPSLMYMKKSVARIGEILEQKPMQGEGDPEIKSCDVEFKQVSFAYNESRVLKDVSFFARSGEVTAIVGPTGSGKSTIANLLARFWDVDEGIITLGGVDVSTINPEHYSKYISFVFQDVVLFNDTVYNNILIGNPEASEEEVLRAAELARCDEFISRLPEGYSTVLLENGKSLSGGERQRISIARAMLKNAPIIILDEATSSLDTMNEYYIHAAISELTKNKTVIIIAHTLRNIVNADNIIVIKDGALVEQGRHDTLMEKNDIYAKLCLIQQRAAKWECRT